MILRVCKAFFLSITLLACSLTASLTHGQTASDLKEIPFEPPEELIYKAEFSRSLLRKLDVADFKLTVSQVARSSEPKTSATEPQLYTLKLTGDAVSQGFFARLFGLTFHQRVESTVEPNAFVVQRTSKVDEQGKRVRSSEAVFDHDRREVTWVERDPGDPTRPERKTTATFQEPIQDVLSAIYFLRLRELEPGKKFEVPISDSGRVYRISMSVGERKRMKTSLGRVSVIRIDPELFGPGGMINEEGTFSIWFTDDSRRVPVSARLKTEYGIFDITLKKASHSNAQIAAK